MKQSYRIWTLSIVFLIVGGYQHSFAQGKKPNIVILATGGTIAGAAPPVPNPPTPPAR